jgi:hypothetical protein
MIARGLAVVTCFAWSGVALAAQQADENKDLDLIPQAAQAPGPAAAPPPALGSQAPAKIFVENAFTQSWRRGGIVAFPPPEASAWQERLLLDARDQWRVGSDISLTYSGRLNARVQDRLDFPSHENLTNDLREAYASWEPMESTFIDAGRINLKSGVALGFNPTDFFKTRAVVEPLSSDPVVLREDRLGTLMLRAQRVWAAGSLTLAYAPAVASASAIYHDSDLHSFDPMFDRTNAQDRFLIKGSLDLGHGFTPELLAYHDGGRTRWGANLAQNIGQRVVAYTEWSGGPRAGLIDEALRFGRATGTLPSSAPGVLPDNARERFRSELAAGFSYTTDQPKITFNAELNYNEGGFSGADWDNWFRTGRGTTSRSPIAGQLWYLRSYALDQQQPVSRSNAFVRADWVDAFIPKLELTSFVNADLLDGSGRFQLAADYYLSDRWTVGGLVLVDFGSRHSDYGSLPEAGSVLLKVVRYF